jgi:hypothetical protein
MHTKIQELIAAFRQRLIDRLNANRPGDYAPKSLPELYAMASKRFPCLHQDVELCTLYTALGKIHSGSVDQNDIEMTGINAWIDAGMSPAIYFTGVPLERRVPLNFIEQIGVKGAKFPDREKLLGNLSLAEFSHCLADRVSFNRMNYYWMRLLTASIPELIEPHNWGHLTTGHIRVKKPMRLRKGEPLLALVPLLLVEAGKDPALYRQAKFELNIVDPLAIESITRQACNDAEDERGMAILEQYIHLEYGGWDAVNLDPVLRSYILNFDFRTRAKIGHGPLNEHFWISRAAGVASNPGSNRSTWPAALYARFILYCCDSEGESEQQNLENLLDFVPLLKVIQNYVVAFRTPIIDALIGTDEDLVLVHPLLISRFDKANKADYIEIAAQRVVDKIVQNLHKESFFLLDKQVCDPDCLLIMSRRANELVDLKELDLSARGHHCMLTLMSAEFRGVEQRERAIAWCTGIMCQKTRLEAMRLLDLTLHDVSLKWSLQDEFLSRDLGL